MMNKEQKRALIEETRQKLIQITSKPEKGLEGIQEVADAFNPLILEYQQEINEVVNPCSKTALPCIIYCLKMTLATLEKDLDIVNKSILSLIENSYHCVSFNHKEE